MIQLQDGRIATTARRSGLFGPAGWAPISSILIWNIPYGNLTANITINGSWYYETLLQLQDGRLVASLTNQDDQSVGRIEVRNITTLHVLQNSYTLGICLTLLQTFNASAVVCQGSTGNITVWNQHNFSTPIKTLSFATPSRYYFSTNQLIQVLNNDNVTIFLLSVNDSYIARISSWTWTVERYVHILTPRDTYPAVDAIFNDAGQDIIATSDSNYTPLVVNSENGNYSTVFNTSSSSVDSLGLVQNGVFAIWKTYYTSPQFTALYFYNTTTGLYLGTKSDGVPLYVGSVLRVTGPVNGFAISSQSDGASFSLYTYV